MKRMRLKFDLRALFVMLMDALGVAVAVGLALWARFDFSVAQVPKQYVQAWLQYMPMDIILTLIIFLLFRMYRFVWRFVSIRDVTFMVIAVLAAFVVTDGLRYVLNAKLPRSVQFMQLVLEEILLVGIRCGMRFWELLKSLPRRKSTETDERIMLIGAGEGGRALAREILSNRHVSARICCAIDDNETKWGKYLEGIPIVGGRDSILYAARNNDITDIIFAIPSASKETRKEILNLCSQTGCRLRTLPFIIDAASGKFGMSDVEDVQVEDLLGREPIKLNTEALREFLEDKVVLVTGGGGSIGSELCRQVALRNPKQLIILDIYENNAYDIQQELKRHFGTALDLHVEIASVRDKVRIYEIFDTYRPDIVLHAAAHKHVPLMEACPSEAIKNNIFGTYHVVRAAEKFGVKKFVMISTDKAVNPTNCMGATKRFCEMILQSREDSLTEFCSVRFGNVLGSNGSVVPLFKKQLEEGGPVTITDKRIIRYFMTISEAAQLVLEAGAMAKQNQIFVLDMGEQVKILTLAENLIRLSGLEPYKDIDIIETGLRPGEKLYEELLMKRETLLATDNQKIFIEQQQTISEEDIRGYLETLDQALQDELPSEELIALLRTIIPTYRSPEEVNSEAIAKNAAEESNDEAAAENVEEEGNCEAVNEDTEEAANDEDAAEEAEEENCGVSVEEEAEMAVK